MVQVRSLRRPLRSGVAVDRLYLRSRADSGCRDIGGQMRVMQHPAEHHQAECRETDSNDNHNSELEIGQVAQMFGQ